MDKLRGSAPSHKLVAVIVHNQNYRNNANMLSNPMPTSNQKISKEEPAGQNMTSNPEQSFLGGRVRALRKRKGLTLVQLSDLSGISVGHISLIERNLSQPSISALMNLAKSLGVTVHWFFDGEGAALDAEQGYVVRAANRMKIRYEGGFVDELLTSKDSRQLEVLYCKIPPGAASSNIFHEGEEAGLIISGELEMWIGDRHFLLNTGDSFNFSSTEPHRYRNPCDSECIAVWVVTPPTF